MSPPADESLAHLLGRLATVESRVRATVTARRDVDPAPDDPFRGLYLGDAEVDRLLEGSHVPPPPRDAGAREQLAAVEARADCAESAGTTIRLRRLARAFDLEPVDVELLLVALAPDIDSRFERLYGYLQDDVTRRRASIGLALELCDIPAGSGPARYRLTGAAPLVSGGVLEVGDQDRPFLTRSLQVADRVAAHLLGDDHVDSGLTGVLVTANSQGGGDAAGLARALAGGARLCYLREQPGATGRGLATAALTVLARPAVAVDLNRIGPNDDPVEIGKAAAREARLRDGGLVAGPIEALVERGVVAVRTFAELHGVVILTGRRSWDPLWSPAVPVLVDVAPPGVGERADLWRENLNGCLLDGVEPGEATLHFRLTPEQVGRAALAARQQAMLHDDEMTVGHLRAGARSQNGAGLESQARRIEPDVDWNDLVLPPVCHGSLRELADRARHRDRVIDEWGMRPGGAKGRGITALFAGDSGTGKSMSAEVIAGALGLDLYSVDLATVVDKYVGETEKHLERVFTEADGVNAVLLFDEADAIFGKRSEVRDAHDRYANIEVAYLLQRMESFDGLAILATNLRANLDDAFTRRLDAVVDFPMPDVEHRRLLWDKCLGRSIPRADNVDLDFCAAQFELSGGNIRSIAVTAAYFAAVHRQPLSMADLVRATQREYRKLGRLCLQAEFGPWMEVITG